VAEEPHVDAGGVERVAAARQQPAALAVLELAKAHRAPHVGGHHHAILTATIISISITIIISIMILLHRGAAADHRDRVIAVAARLRIGSELDHRGS
jgi:uncharacterized membrane protein YozB (DUF420 family)